MMQKDTLGQFVRFVIIGLLSTALNYGIFFFLLQLNVNYMWASAVGYISGVLAGFVFNKNWTFTKSSSNKSYLFKYLLLYAVSLGVSLLFLNLTVGKAGMDAKIANFFCIVLTTIINFAGTKYVVFKT
jgi:putative flippase GtrA